MHYFINYFWLQFFLFKLERILTIFVENWLSCNSCPRSLLYLKLLINLKTELVKKQCDSSCLPLPQWLNMAMEQSNVTNWTGTMPVIVFLWYISLFLQICNPLSASVALIQNSVNSFEEQINWLISIWGQH